MKPSHMVASGIAEELLKLVNDYSPVRCQGAPEERLYHDLRISGDDALELLDKYSTLFNVDLGNFQFTEYFPYEGGSLAANLMGLHTTPGQPYKELTIGDLLAGILRGRLAG